MSARKLTGRAGKRQPVSREDVYSLEVWIPRANAWHESALWPLKAGEGGEHKPLGLALGIEENWRLPTCAPGCRFVELQTGQRAK